jgi:hypothetical protein
METSVYLEMGLVGLAAIGMLTAGALRGWRGWLELKRLELQARNADDALPPSTTMSSRIELADLRERIRKLEAIAAGVDL